ncbi:alpha/beta hydrolase, partial [Staphylococcus epidermidis]|uniref:alpha/beta hydrolase n=1 Tax=Staphylococcus epidermidis TaxID=1282 RepID=UPI0037D99E31
ITIYPPIQNKAQPSIYQPFLQYPPNFKKYQPKHQQTIHQQIQQFHPTQTLRQLNHTLNPLKQHLDQLIHPILLLQPQQHTIIHPQSPNYIYNHLHSHQKQIKSYQHSGHVITIDKEKDKLFQHVYQFLESF